MSLSRELDPKREEFIMKEKTLVKSLFLALALTMFGGTAPDGMVAPVMAQQVTGTISGTVTDEQGAIIPGAQVVAKNTGTGAEITTKTNENGVYRIPSLVPGAYVVTITADGFKKVENAGIDVKLGVTTGVDVTLQVGASTDIVEVTGGEVLIERDTSQISANYDARKVVDLPNNIAGGGVDAVAFLTPGVVSTGDAGFGNTNGGSFSVNGGRGRSNNFSIDGQDNNDISVTGPAVGIDNADIVQEFQIVTNNFSAEYGQAGSAVINIVTKGGSNEYHGTLSYFHQDQKNFGTLTVQERASGQKEAPFFLDNTAGATLGGKIIKDKLFFYTSYQGIRIAQSNFLQSTASGLTLTPNGIATALQVVSPAIANVIKQGFPLSIPLGNPSIRPDIPTRMVTVNIGGKPTPLEFGAIQRNFSSPFEENLTTARLDYNATSKLRVFGRYLYQKSESGSALAGINGFSGDTPSRSQQLGVTAIYQVSPRATNEFRFNYSRLRVSFGGGSASNIPDQGNADKAFGFFNLPSGFIDVGPATNLPQGRINDNYQFLDNFSITLGKHSLKAGADLKRRLTDSSFLPNQNGTFNFSSLGSFFNNTPTSVTIAIGPNKLNFTEFDQAYYFEDAFRIKDNLTLTLGVRYENSGQPINILNEITLARESDPTTAIFNKNVPLSARVFPAIDTDNNNFAPRIGIAYTPRFSSKLAKTILGDNKTVIRGGYGISYDLTFYNILLNSATAAPAVFSTTFAGTAGLIPTDPTGPGIRGAVTRLIPVGTADPRLLNRTTVSNDFHSPYTQQFSFGIQRQFKNDTVVEARYVGTRGVGLFQSVNANPLVSTLFQDFPQFLPAGVRPSPSASAAANGRLVAGQGPERSRINGASSIYHGLQTRFDTRIKSLIVGASYTFSKQIDNASEIFGTFGGGGTIAFSQNPFDTTRGERSLGAYDFRHVFSTNFIYEIPSIPALRGNKLAQKLLSGYQISGTFRANTAQKFTPTQFFFGSPYVDARFSAAFNSGVEFVRPFLGNPNAPASSVAIDNDTAANFFGVATPSPTGFYLLNTLNSSPNVAPKAVTLDQVRYIANTPTTALLFGSPYGNVARNSAKGEPLYLGNFSFFKNTKLTERINLQFRADMFNVFNHPNLGTPDVFIDDAGNGFADKAFSDSGRRTVEFGLKLIF